MRCSTFLLITLATAGSALSAADFDQGLLNLVPQGAQVLAGFQVDQGKASALGQYVLLRAERESPQFQNLIDATDFDPRRDLQQVLIAGWGGAGDGARAHRGVVLARGTFDRARIKQAVLAHGGNVYGFQGFDIMTGKDDNSHSFALLDATLAVIGDQATVKSVITNRNNPATLDGELEKRMQSVINGNEAWFASILPGTQFPFRRRAAPTDRPNAGQASKAAIQAIVQSSGGIHLTPDSVEVAFDALTRTEKDAQSLCDVVRFFASMVQMQRQNETRAALLAPVLDRMQLTTGGNTMHLALSIPENTVEKLISQPAPRREAAARGL
jgi:hypothetical protein